MEDASPSARKVWIEILQEVQEDSEFVSPSARKVWIEMLHQCKAASIIRRRLPQGRCGLKYNYKVGKEGKDAVAFRKEGVD